MTPFDLSVIVFFVAVMAKALVDSFEFWAEQDEAASKRSVVSPAPRHLPAPCRPAPSPASIRRTPSAVRAEHRWSYARVEPRRIAYQDRRREAASEKKKVACRAA